MALPIFPCSPGAQSETWWIENASRGGGQGINGGEQIVQSPAGRWRAKIPLVIKDDRELMDVRGFIAGLSGRAGRFLIGPYDWRGRPWPLDVNGKSLTPFNANRRDAGYDLTSSVINVVAAAAAPINATSLQMTVVNGAPLQRGHYFSVGDHLHIITGVSGVSGGITSVTFRPWLRDAVAQGDLINFGSPRGTMRLNADDVGPIELTTSPFSYATLDLVEAL